MFEERFENWKLPRSGFWVKNYLFDNFLVLSMLNWLVIKFEALNSFPGISFVLKFPVLFTWNKFPFLSFGCKILLGIPLKGYLVLDDKLEANMPFLGEFRSKKV